MSIQRSTYSSTIQTSSLTNKQYMALAVPIIISQMTTPLLGAVDTAVVGQLPNPIFIGGVAVGSLIFNTLYWVLGFLRVSTSGFTSQAHGANNHVELQYSLLRPMFIAMVIGGLFVLLQEPIKWAALTIIDPSSGVAEQAALYYDIRIWGAPFTLMSYVILGWLIGSSHVKLTVYLQIGMNVLNILLDIVFVTSLNMGVVGVSIASLIAEVGVTVVGIFILIKLKLVDLTSIQLIKNIFEKNVFLKMIKVNRDLFIRSISLLTVYTLFTSKGAQMGEVELAANAILFQLHYIMAYALGGFGNAGSILVGRAIGANNLSMFNETIKLSAKWGILSGVFLSLLFFICSSFIYPLFTSIEQVIQCILQYQGWLLLFPVVGFWGIILNGVFSGATEAIQIRNSMIISMILFIILVYLLTPILGNHGLWISFTLFTLSRSLVLGFYLPKLSKGLF
ncbi:MATE family efflux transporter [Bacillus sp. 1NLA3E]|uniref:MATE family efflux transporter n=1 Tax=Bacillus sp. 1NLA3E TaxID=666686 RepID=UPI000247EC8C|nr:MATE family efflux transporter [Bacillus sp. 1NLA3E]AGK54389.1 DNA-damage-inducible MATE, Na+/multidrug efflux [Bacillus sp. 1NLA3E]